MCSEQPAFFFIILILTHTQNSRHLLCIAVHQNILCNICICMEIDELIPQMHLQEAKDFSKFSSSFYRTYVSTLSYLDLTFFHMVVVPANRKTFSGMYSKCLCLLFLVKCFDIILDTKPRLPNSYTHNETNS